jgi:hypothetical protein
MYLSCTAVIWWWKCHPFSLYSLSLVYHFMNTYCLCACHQQIINLHLGLTALWLDGVKKRTKMVSIRSAESAV